MYLLPVQPPSCPPLSGPRGRLPQYLGDLPQILQVGPTDSLFGSGTLGLVGMGLGAFGAISLLRKLLGKC
jgi:hypothetical protein